LLRGAERERALVPMRTSPAATRSSPQPSAWRSSTRAAWPAPPEVPTMRMWLDNWRGVGDVVAGGAGRGV